MNKQHKRQRELRTRIFIYGIMILAVLGIVTVMILLMVGYRFNRSTGSVEQTGVAQLGSQPTGANIEIDGIQIAKKTNSKISLYEGDHEFVMWQEGYETWRKTVPITAGELTWIDYVRLLPKERTTESVLELGDASSLSFSPDGRFAIGEVQQESRYTLQLIDLEDDTAVTSATLDIRSKLSDGLRDNPNVRFNVKEWSQNGRYVAVNATTDSANEWLLVDREDFEGGTVNVSALINLPISSMVISGASGRAVYILQNDGDVRRVTLDDGSISRPYARDVEQFNLYGENTLTYSTRADDRGVIQAGIIAGEDADAVVLHEFNKDEAPVRIQAAEYYRKDYVTITSGNEMRVYEGEYPRSALAARSEKGELAAFPTVHALTLPFAVEWLQFSNNGRFIIFQNKDGFMSYDLELDRLSETANFNEPVNGAVEWIDSYMLWNVSNGQLYVREFDGANVHALTVAMGNSNEAEFDASLSRSEDYIYSVADGESGRVLQRTSLLVEE
ncbi:PEGA domain-containing protein [Candidatus Saccharibacteria bacterium]|nr:PEGA domain-containing protein [Candidatus Saccharibacteria bacterium]